MATEPAQAALVKVPTMKISKSFEDDLWNTANKQRDSLCTMQLFYSRHCHLVVVRPLG